MAEITIQQYIRDLRKLKGRKARHQLTLVNSMPYARHLNNRHGYFVFNDNHLQNITEATFKKAIRQGVPLLETNRRRALMASAIKELNWLRSKTSELRPPKPKSKKKRRAHPGHWADRRGHLKNAYWYEVDGKARRKKSATLALDKAAVFG